MQVKGNKAVALNMVANIISFTLNLIISFFLTPYITKHVGLEAYGLVGLANSFVGYLTILTSAINSMAGRFIIIELHKGNHDQANVFYTSVLYANTLFALLLVIPTLFLVFNIDILNVSTNLIFDAQITFALIAVSFAINLIFSQYGIVLYAKNILWKGSFRVIESNIIRLALIFLFFYIFRPQIYYVVLATFISTLYTICFNVYYTETLLPSRKIAKRYYSLKALWKLVSSGIWNSITKLSQILLDGLDLLLTNLFINGTITGYISIAKTVPMLYTSVVALLSDSFYPRFLELYSKGNKKELLKEINNSISVLSTISGICLSLLIVYAKDFYFLWVPNTDSLFLRNITYCAVGTVLISGCIYSLFYVFALTNKVKTNSIVLLATSICSVITTFFLLKFTNLGVYAIVGVSSIFGVIRNLTFTPIYAARCLQIRWYSFYPIILKNLTNIALLLLVDNVVKSFVPTNTWGGLVMNGIICLSIGIIITIFVVLNKNERHSLLRTLHLKK